MAGSIITIKLNDDQQKQIREATGKTVTELTLGPAATGQLSDQALEGTVGGVSIKTISWSGVDGD
jgi:hypothetical protein